jgi:TPR repeat protein
MATRVPPLGAAPFAYPPDTELTALVMQRCQFCSSDRFCSAACQISEQASQTYLKLQRKCERGETSWGRLQHAEQRVVDQAVSAWENLSRKQKHSRSLFALGFVHEHGRGVPKDLGKAAEFYRVAASQGMSEAQAALGKLYRDGRGLRPSDAKAVRLFRQAARNSNPESFFNMGKFYHERRGDLKRDLSAKRGCLVPPPADSTSVPPLDAPVGVGVTSDDVDEADVVGVALLRSARRLDKDNTGHARARASTSLALCHLSGRGGMATDPAAALDLIARAAESGYSRAQFNMGLAFDKGLFGTKPDKRECAKWWRMAADQVRTRLHSAHSANGSRPCVCAGPRGGAVLARAQIPPGINPLSPKPYLSSLPPP